MTVQLTQEQFQELLGRISAMHSSANMNFTQCTLRFHGERDHTKVEEFINAVTAFKQLNQIPDEDALFGLPLLLKDGASSWWAEVCSEVNTWTEALDRIRSEFTPKPPAYEVYLQIFANPQARFEDIDSFLNGKRRLLGMLPADRHSEEVQLDLIYGLLRQSSRNDLPRSTVKTFAELAKKVRHLESVERTNKLTKSISSHSIIPSHNVSKSIAQPSIVKRKRCSFCRYKGHTVELCKKRMAQLLLAEGQLKNKAAMAATAKSVKLADSPMSPTSTVDSPRSPTVADSPASPTVADSPMSPPVADLPMPPPVADSPMSPPVADLPMPPPVANLPMTRPMTDSPMSPTSSADEEPDIYCFGCRAPNVWKSICAKCKNG